MRRRYITENGLLERERKRKRRKKEDGCSSYHPWKLSPLSTKEPRRRRISLQTKPEDKLLPFLHTFDHPISLWSCPAVGALTKTLFLSPFSLPNLLYRPRWVWAHFPNSKEPPKSGLYSYYLSFFICLFKELRIILGVNIFIKKKKNHEPKFLELLS